MKTYLGMTAIPYMQDEVLVPSAEHPGVELKHRSASNRRASRRIHIKAECDAIVEDPFNADICENRSRYV